MPAKSSKQANAAKSAGAVKAGKFPKKKAGKAVKAMAKMPMSRLKHFMKMKESMSLEQKRRLLVGLKKLREQQFGGNQGGTTDIANADNLVAEDDFTSQSRNVVAKTFETQGDYDSYVNQHRGIEMTSKEQQSILGYKPAKPTQQDKFFVKYESTDDFGNNDTTVIKKLKEGNQFTWTAFAKHESTEDEGKPEGSNDEPSPDNEKGSDKGGPDLGDLGLKEQDEMGQSDDVTVNDPIRITKTITFTNDSEGSDILSDFLIKLDL